MKQHQIELTGNYLGTEINEKWWRRYTGDKMLARGMGTFTCEKNTIAFKRYLIKQAVQIDVAKIREFKIGKSHSGQWAGGKEILKVVWDKEGRKLSSGFTFDEFPGNVNDLIKLLKETIELN